MSSSYYNRCGSCINLLLGDRIGGKFYCPIQGAYYPLDDNTCSRYSVDSDRTDYDIKVALGEAGSSCYITTICTKILRLSDNHEFLNIMRSFRNNILNKDIKYKKILMDYDILGPIISLNILKDPNNIDLCINIFRNYLSDVLVYLQDKEYDNAINKYIEMVLYLNDYYNIDLEINYNDYYDITKGGHGKYEGRIYK